MWRKSRSHGSAGGSAPAARAPQPVASPGEMASRRNIYDLRHGQGDVRWTLAAGNDCKELMASLMAFIERSVGNRGMTSIYLRSFIMAGKSEES